MKVLNRVLFFLIFMSCKTLYAVEVNKLYETEVYTFGELEKNRKKATQKALQTVLNRILAGEDILKNKTVKKVLNNASYYVREFQYSLGKSEPNGGRLMRILFDEQLVINSLRSGTVGLWNEIRPRTLVWLVVEKQGKQQFFDSELMNDVDLALNKATKTKKLPVLYPIQDLNENQKVSISDVLSAYSGHLLEVSTRYDVVSTLAGKMVDKGSCWKAEWTHYFDRKISQWSSPCGAMNDVALNGFQGVYKTLANYYAVTPEIKEVDSVVLKISHINNILEGEQVNSYLESLPMVKTVTWVNKELGYDNYRLFYQGKRTVLNHRLAKDHFLNLEGYSKINAKEVMYQLMTER